MMKKRRRVSGAGAKNAVVGCAWYRPEQWQRLLEVSEDRDKLESTFEAWEEIAENALSDFADRGVQVRKVDVDIEELVDWCRARNLPVNAGARSECATEKIEQQVEGERERGET